MGATAREEAGEGEIGSDKGGFGLHPKGDRSQRNINQFYKFKRISLVKGGRS